MLRTKYKKQLRGDIPGQKHTTLTNIAPPSKKKIKEEENLQLHRLFVIRILNLLYVLNPSFYDEDKDEIAEPFRSIFGVYYDAVHDDGFIASLSGLVNAGIEHFRAK